VTTLKKLVDGSLAIIQPMLNVKNIELHLLFNQDPTVKTYPREIRQVILNILKNAEDVLVENAIQNPQIWIRTFYKDGKSCLEIEDNGGGIPNDILNKIFDPYFSTKFEKDGTGIGLYMSKTIVEQHNKGSLTAYNTTNGVCFKITLPTLKYIKHKEKNSTS
jgi:signal transduction histidine kinase